MSDFQHRKDIILARAILAESGPKIEALDFNSTRCRGVSGAVNLSQSAHNSSMVQSAVDAGVRTWNRDVRRRIFAAEVLATAQEADNFRPYPATPGTEIDGAAW
jgi:hypothetical protein